MTQEEYEAACKRAKELVISALETDSWSDEEDCEYNDLIEGIRAYELDKGLSCADV